MEALDMEALDPPPPPMPMRETTDDSQASDHTVDINAEAIVKLE
mgnify:CR=1 FL=1